MRIFIFIFIAVGWLVVLGLASSGPAEAAPAATEMLPGLIEDISEPFFEDQAFPLASLITPFPDAQLETYRGRCLQLDIFGEDRTSRCEQRLAVSFTGGQSTVHWFAIGNEALGLESTTPVERPSDHVLRLPIEKIYRVRDGKRTSEFALGTCRVDAFYVDCHTIGKSGRFDARFATIGGPPTQQYPIEDAFLRIPKAVVSTARGQCDHLYVFGSNKTAYCASFVGKAILDNKAVVTIFTADGHLAFGLYGLIRDTIAEADGSTTTPITRVLRIIGDEKAGTAPASGTCKSVKRDDYLTVVCKIVTEGGGGVFDASFVTSEPWQKTVRTRTN